MDSARDSVSLRAVKSLKRLTQGLLGTVVVLSVFAAGCGGTTASGSTGKDPEVIVVNASPDADPLAYFFNDDQYGGDLASKMVSALFMLPPLDPSAGGYDVSLEDPDRFNQWDIQQLTFAKDSSTILAAVGLRDPGSEPLKRLRFVSITPNRVAPIGNRCRLIILHAFLRQAGFGTPKLALQNDTDNPTFQSSSVSFGDSTVLEVDSGTYSGANHWLAKDPDNDQIYIDNPGVTLKPATIYLVLISGLEGANPTITFKEIPPTT